MLEKVLEHVDTRRDELCSKVNTALAKHKAQLETGEITQEAYNRFKVLWLDDAMSRMDELDRMLKVMKNNE